MKINVKNTALVGILLIALAMLSSCSVPFSYVSNTYTVELSSALGTYQEIQVAVPDEALNNNINYSKVQVDYAVRNPTLVDAGYVKLYVSTDQVDDDSYDAATSETIVDANLGTSSGMSGSVESQNLRDVLNARQPYFILGGELQNYSPSSVYIDVTITLTGTYSLF